MISICLYIIKDIAVTAAVYKNRKREWRGRVRSGLSASEPLQEGGGSKAGGSQARDPVSDP